MGRKSTGETARRLLAAAAEVFAEKDYRSATVSEICQLAGANIAAVNYHFRDKETLYAKAWRHAFSESIKARPPDGGIPLEASPEKRFRGQITAFLRRIGDPNNKEFWIAQKEIINPTGLLAEVMAAEIMPLHRRMEGVVRELLGPDAGESQVHFSVLSIINQCTGPIAVSRSDLLKAGNGLGPPRITDIDSYAEHVVNFSLAALSAFRNNAKAQPRNGKAEVVSARQRRKP
jgi:TetR/AcrR family transcriptional regulator, regulator of cefoperazone and chloramphenicol sensitivity